MLINVKMPTINNYKHDKDNICKIEVIIFSAF